MSENQKSEIRNQKSLDEAERNQKSEIRNQKSLDEVIEQYEYCFAIGETACGGCRYRDEDGVCRMRENALPYLKQYRSDKLEWEAQKKGYKVKMGQRVETAKIFLNTPVYCGNCGKSVGFHMNYCQYCGCRLEWDD